MTDRAFNGKEAIEILKQEEFALVLMDIKMPVMNGMEALRRIKRDYPYTEVIMTTAVEELNTAVSCMKEGAYSYISKPIGFEALDLDIQRALERRRLVLENQDYQRNLEIKVEERTQEVKALYHRLEKSFFSSIRIFIELIELYDPFIGSHCKRVGILAGEVAKRFPMSKIDIQEIQTAGYLHDIGKLGIPEHIDKAPFEKLNERDICRVKKQTIYAQEVLSTIDRLKNAALFIRSHLERVDGTGFPNGLKGDEIPIESRILSVVNAYDEMRFRCRFSLSSTGKPDERVALSHLKEYAGKRFDRDVVNKLEEVLSDLKTSKKPKELVSIEELRGGMTLAEDITDKTGKIVFKKGSLLSAIQIMKIQGLGEDIKEFKKEVYVYA